MMFEDGETKWIDKRNTPEKTAVLYPSYPKFSPAIVCSILHDIYLLSNKKLSCKSPQSRLKMYP